MSFILDALKKAESERNRNLAPVLMDARIAPPRRGLPAWAWALGAVLAVNLGVLAWLLLGNPAPARGAAGPAVDAAPAAALALPVAQTPPAAAPPLPAITASAPAATPSSAVLAPALTPEDESDLPSMLELRAAGVALPELQLNLHIYDPAPLHRSVLLNGQRMREGEFTPDGVKVERITPQAVVLEASGRRFRINAAD
jgi:general secretion pathway protein B